METMSEYIRLRSAITDGDVMYGEPVDEYAPVVHGHWKWVHRYESYECSACGGEVPCDDWGNEQLTDYCPHCGAKMDEEVK